MLIERRFPRGTPAERRAAGRKLRAGVGRRTLGRYEPAPKRTEPVAWIEESDADRVAELVPVRHHRMAASAFAFYRGAAGIMAADLAAAPTTGLHTHLCGDAHLSNFGLFGTPERHLVFDVNDFDETAPGPFEWDVKRLAASVVLAARHNGLRPKAGRACAGAAADAYAARMRRLARCGPLETWQSRIDADELAARYAELTGRGDPGGLEALLARARRHTSEGALPKLTVEVDGRRRILPDAPYIVATDDAMRQVVRTVLAGYRRTLRPSERLLLERFDVVDAARKVVGVGSVGFEAFVVLLDADGAPLFLQIKQAHASVLEPYGYSTPYANQGQRVVVGQRTMQATSDVFLGWLRYAPTGQDLYVRQLRDMKGSIPVDRLDAEDLRIYAAVCGDALARAHARGGDAAAIAGYCGGGSAFAGAIAAFGVAYADQGERDFEAFLGAIGEGRLRAEPG